MSQVWDVHRLSLSCFGDSKLKDSLALVRSGCTVCLFVEKSRRSFAGQIDSGREVELLPGMLSDQLQHSCMSSRARAQVRAASGASHSRVRSVSLTVTD